MSEKRCGYSWRHLFLFWRRHFCIGAAGHNAIYNMWGTFREHRCACGAQTLSCTTEPQA